MNQNITTSLLHVIRYPMYLFGCVLLMAAGGCEKSSTGVPECVEAKIKDFQNSEKKNPPVEIWTYTYQGKTVYYIASYCCDIPSQVVDANCNTLCSPDGGITGKGDGKCADFFNEAKSGKRIWKDDR